MGVLVRVRKKEKNSILAECVGKGVVGEGLDWRVACGRMFQWWAIMCVGVRQDAVARGEGRCVEVEREVANDCPK